MARPLRIEYPGAWYHAMNRGVGRRTIFPCDTLRQQFLSLLADIHDRFAICCHAYCLMSNHYHLMLHTPRGGLSRAMRHLDGVYTQRHNRQQQTDGPLFRGRYKAQLIECGDYLWAVSRYIHRNPLEAGLCRSPTDYPWSSYRFFTGEQGAPAWLYRHRTLRQFRSVDEYRVFVESEDALSAEIKKALSVLQEESCPPILGSEAFVEATLQTVPYDYEIPQSRRTQTTLSVDSIVDSVCAARGWPRDTLIKPADKQARWRRALVMTAVSQYTAASLSEIGAVFDIHYSTAASAISRFRDNAKTGSDSASDLQLLRELLWKMGNGQT